MQSRCRYYTTGIIQSPSAPLHHISSSQNGINTTKQSTMKFILALFVAFVSMASAFVPAANLLARGAVVSQRARASTPLVRNMRKLGVHL